MRENFKPATRRSDLILAASTAVVFLLVSAIFNLEKALAFSMVWAVFVAIVQTKTADQKDKRFWLLLSLFAIVHVVALVSIEIPDLKFGLIVLPFALIDGLVMWWLLNRIERK